jgi:nicotinamide phosphoribosyltransferase
MIEKFAKPGAIFAMVADSYDVFQFCHMLGTDSEIRDKLIAHGKTGGFAVIRPDSGDPAEVCSTVMDILNYHFGSTVNAKGYNVLNYLRVIQGDGVNYESIADILISITQLGYSADNIAFGMGGALLQQLNRDTQRFAMKASATKVDDKWVGICKDPVTDTGKRSKSGRVILIQDSNGSYRSGVEDWERSALVPIYRNGTLLTEWSFQDIRDRANN